MAGASIRRLARSAGILIERASILSVPATRLIRQLVDRNLDLILDVGANDGGYGREIYSAGYCGQMISFEPLPAARQGLERATAKFPGWTMAPAVALSDSQGKVIFHEAGNSASSSLLTMNEAHVKAAPESAIRRTFAVDTARLDDLAGSLRCNRPHFLKIDTQGSESLVLDGAPNTLRHAVGIQIEMSLQTLYDGQSLWREMDDRLTNLGFSLWDIIPGFRDRQTGQLMQFDGVYFRST